MSYLKVMIISVCFTLLLCSCDSNNKNLSTDNLSSDTNKTDHSKLDADGNNVETETSSILDIRETLGYFMDAAYLVCEDEYIAYITSSGTVYLQPMNDTGRYVEELGKVVSIYGNEHELAALNSEGKIIIYSISDKTLATEPEDIKEIYSDFELGGETIARANQIKESLLELQDIVYINLNYPYWYYAILKDSTKVMEGITDKFLTNLSDIVKMASNDSDIIGLKSDGSILYDVSETKENEIRRIEQWSNIIDIEYGSYAFGLKKDGTVVSSWINKECDVELWKDIVQISASYNTTAGLTKEGTVNVALDIDYGQRNAEEWEDIAAIKASTYYIVGIKEDGTLLITPSSDSRFKNIDLSNVPEAYVPSW